MQPTSAQLTATHAQLRQRVQPNYCLRLAGDAADLQAAQALRFEVFNLELDEGMAHIYDSGLDADPFDAVCQHLVVEDSASGQVVGTYRVQSGATAQAHLGYYSEREFDFSPLEQQRSQILELGRACIHRQHRSFAVLNLLWKGIGVLAREQGLRYLVGCSSLTTQNEAEGAAAYEVLSAHLAPAAWLTRPHPRFACSLDGAKTTPAPRTPRLLQAYLALGAGICGPPAIDREFKTIDFLTWIDVESPSVLAMQQRGRFVVSSTLSIPPHRVADG